MKNQLNSLRTLVVDDSEDDCALLSAQLRSLDPVKVVGFLHDGAEAISYLRGAEPFENRERFPYPDLLLLDFNMPRCGGMGVLEFLRRQICRPRVILWSNTLEQVSVPLALRLGADLVCNKPADKHQLIETLRRLQAQAFKTFPVPPPVQKPEVVCVNA